MSDINLPWAGSRALKAASAFAQDRTDRRWAPIVGLGLAAVLSMGLWGLIVAAVMALI